MKLAVITPPNLPHLSLLKKLPAGVEVVTGNSPGEFADAIAEVDVVMNGMGTGDTFRTVFSQAKRLRWVHSLSAGVENVLTPEMLASTTPLTNARGVFAESLGEFVIAAALFFAKDLRRMRRSQAAGK